MSPSSFHSELSPPSDMKLCHACLRSVSKSNMTILRQDQHFVLGVMSPETLARAKATAQFLLCWECDSAITSTQQLQAKLHRTHLKRRLLLQGVETIVEGLSTLTTTEAETINITPQ